MSRKSRQAVVIGAGHNGLVAAITLADAGWDVVVLEAANHPGGAVYSDRSLHPDFVTDWFSAFYPLGVASPVLSALDLDQHGLRWAHAPAVLAHVLPDDRCALLSRDLHTTASSLDAFAPGDGAAWIRLSEQFEAIREPLVRALLGPFPPVRAAISLARAMGAAELVRFVRFALESARRAGDELFAGEGGPLLLAGNALHTDLPPEASSGAVYGWLLAMLGQSVGFPVPVGGSGALTDALVARAKSAGVTLRVGVTADTLDIDEGRVVAVRTVDGERIGTHSVLADVGAPALYQKLIGISRLPRRLVDDLGHFQWDCPTMKLNWALSTPVPWTASAARAAGTVHLGVDMNGLTRYSAALATRDMPREPFVLFGQMTTADPSRSPAGTESAWAYTHVPEGIDYVQRADLIAEQVERIEAAVEARAPGFGSSVLARNVQSPVDLEAHNANLVNGAVGAGTANIHQQLIFRPIPGLGRAETPIDGVYLAGASAHPGGGVHGAPGANAARAAMSRAGLAGSARRRALDVLYGRIYR